MAEGDAAASVVWQGVFRSPLMRAGAGPVVVVPALDTLSISLLGNPLILYSFRLGVVGNVGDGLLNISHGGNYKPGGGGIR